MLPLGGYVQFAGDMNPASAGVDKIPLDIKSARAGSISSLCGSGS
jgi:hypothetical protein